MRQPLVSVVTPSLNQAAFIAATIESVRAQEYPHVEHRIVDGGSSDGTADTVAGYDGVIFSSEADRGQADAVNKGMRAARSEIVGWLNSDDTYLPGAISTAVEALQARPDAVAVFGNAYYTDAAGEVIEPYPTAPTLELDAGCFVCQPSVFMRASALREVDYLDTSLDYCMDYDLWIRLSRLGPFVHTPAFLATSRLHASSKSAEQQLEARCEAVQMTHRRLGATPLPLLYGYADALGRTSAGIGLNDPPNFKARLRTATVLPGLLGKYHRRWSARDLALLAARLRAGHALKPDDL